MPLGISFIINKILNKFPVPDELVNVGAHIRNRWIAEKAAAVGAGSRVLDAGAGECQYRPLFAHCDYKAQDFSQYTGTSAGSQAERWDYGPLDYVSDIASIPVPDASFDVILCTEVLEHVPNPVEALREFSRILSPGGKLLLSAPLSSGLHQQPFHYYGGYSPHFYRKFLSELDLEIVEMLPTGGLMKHVGQEVHRVGRIIEERDPYRFSPLKKYILMRWLPLYLGKLDSDLFVEEFTVGYLVEAVKKLPSADQAA